jgi:hypothetical protein
MRWSVRFCCIDHCILILLAGCVPGARMALGLFSVVSAVGWQEEMGWAQGQLASWLKAWGLGL